MSVPGIMLSTGAAFVALFLIFRPIEATFPADSQQKILRPNWFVDLLFFLGQYLIWNALVIWVVVRFGTGIRDLVPVGFRQWVASNPAWLQFLGVIVLSDFIIYWAHRAQHRFPLLWRFHAVHHTAEHLDWLAAHREHPLDTIYTVGLLNVPVYLCGVPVELLGLFTAFRGMWAVYIHSNVRLPIGPLRMLIGAPELHHWHHDRDRSAGNYANLSPLMDIMFGTYRCPDHEPESFGIDKPVKQNYLSLLLYPFRQK